MSQGISLGLFLLLLGGVPHASAQTAEKSPAGAAKQQPSPVVKTTTRLVQVSVVVQDKNGASLPGLTREDFKVLDGGVPQDIAFFAKHSAEVLTPKPLPPNVFTNRTDLKGQDPGATIVLLFDVLNTSFEDQSFARAQVLKFLKTAKPQDHIALMALGEQLFVLHDFTDDTEALRQSVDRFSPRLLAQFDASNPEPFHVEALRGSPSWAQFEASVNNANGQVADRATLDRIRATYAALAAIASYVGTIPGHKSLVWVSGGIPIRIGSNNIGIPDRDSLEFGDSDVPGLSTAEGFNGLAKILNRVNMSIYPIDVHGLDVSDSQAAFQLRQDLRQTDRLLAEQTGGKAFYGTNDVAAAIDSALDDGRYTYTIGFYPNHGTWDGKFRKIKIEAAPQGVHLRYRRGYYATPENGDEKVLANGHLQEASFSPLDSTDLGMTVRMKPLMPVASRIVQMQVTLDPKEFLLHEVGGRQRGGLDLVYLQRNTKGKFVAADKQHLDVNLSTRDFTAMSKDGLILQRKVTISPDAAEFRLLVRDAESGAMGSVTVPVKKFL